jgi:hypothetical protein
MKLVSVYNLNYYSLNIFFRSAVLRSNCDRHWIKIIVNAVVGQATNNNAVLRSVTRLGCSQIKIGSLRCVACPDYSGCPRTGNKI